jgi:hypothetical protein
MNFGTDRQVGVILLTLSFFLLHACGCDAAAARGYGGFLIEQVFFLRSCSVVTSKTGIISLLSAPLRIRTCRTVRFVILYGYEMPSFTLREVYK